MKKILLITLSNIGDVILTTPVISSLKEQFPDSFLTVVCGPKATGLLAGSRSVDRLVIYDKKGPFFSQAAFLVSLWTCVYDLVVDLRNTAIPFLVPAWKRSPLFRKEKKGIHSREKHLNVLRQTGIEAKTENQFDFFGPKEISSLVDKLKMKGIPEQGWIVVSPLAASSTKTWKREGFQEVIRYLLKTQRLPVLLTGDTSQKEIVDSFAKGFSERVFSLAGELDLRELGALVARAKLLVSNDSAVMHLGHELNRPVVAVFGPTDPVKYGRDEGRFKLVRLPLECSPCELAQCRSGSRKCFEDLCPQKVIEACEELLTHASFA